MTTHHCCTTAEWPLTGGGISASLVELGPTAECERGGVVRWSRVEDSMLVKAGRQRLRASGWAWRAASSPEAARAAKAAKGPHPVASSALVITVIETYYW